MICPNLKIVFIHVPKCAGTSIESALICADGGDPDKKEWGKYLLYNQGNQHWSWSRIVQERPECREWRSFAVVRHPFDRAVSEFYYQRTRSRGRRDELYKHEAINAAIRTGRFFNYAEAFHNMPQHKFVGPETRILKFENLAEEWEQLQKDWGFKADLPKKYSHQRPEDKKDPELWKRILSPESLQHLTTRFKEDLDRFYG